MAHRSDLTLRILQTYDLDARQSFANISRKLGPSRDAIRKVIKDLEASNTIRGYITVLDIGKLGYTAYAVYVRLDTTSEDKVKKLAEYLKKQSEIYWIATLGGRFDLLFAIQTKSVVQFSHILSDIQRRFPFIADPQFAIRMRSTQFQRTYLSDRLTKRIQGGFEARDEKETITERERALLQLLVSNPQESVANIATHLQTTRVTALATLRRLETRGIIQGYSTLLSCVHLGYECYLLLITLKRFDQSTRGSLRKFASQESAIIFCVETIGPWHTEFHCEVKNQRELQELVRKIRTSFAVELASIESVPSFEYYIKYRLKV